ncbi:type II toxin-antitoxin system Phd/YefM family antitoxin [Actinomyces johnsonii]|nr:type II toxin-antitoxin system Phd/YefM family antitoxin [Actinomyces johnsonii]
MSDLPVSVARSRLDDAVDDARASHEPVFLTRRGRRVAAVIDADDLKRLTQVAEDLADIEAADAARAEIAEHGTIPWGEVKAGPRARIPFTVHGLREQFLVRHRTYFAGIPHESRRAVDRAERGQP